MDEQYRAFDAERARWNTERAGLLGKVAALEEALNHQSIPSFPQAAMHGRDPDFSRPLDAKETSGELGAQTPAKPSGTHSEPSTCAPTAGTGLSTTSNNISPSTKRKNFVESFERSGLAHKPSIVGLDKIDGIILKSTSTTGLQHEEGHSSESSSFQNPDSDSHPPSSSTPLREGLRPPIQNLTLHPVDETQEANRTRDAGHTPLAPAHYFLDGTADGSPIRSPPSQAAQQERPPLEPQTTTVRRRPLEHSDSYFPPSSPPENLIEDEDPELQEPLSLQHSVFDDKSFLAQVDNKLLQSKQSAALKTSQKNITSRRRSGGGNDGGGDSREDTDERLEHPEPDPPIIFKKSLNFGSQLGKLGSGRGPPTIE
ncbi:MAG: hypothetical protein Q9212_001040 [Teloschistes hypoglaucus]